MGNHGGHAPRKAKNFYFGDVIKKKSYGKEFITVTKPILNKQQYSDWKANYDIAQGMNKDSLYLPDDCDYRAIQKSNTSCGGCCGAEAQTQMTYQQIDFLLSSELINRRQKNKHYQQPELLLILYELLQGAKQFQKKDLSIGDIRPKNILITREGKLKMVNIASFPWQKTSIQKITDGFDNTTIFYIAPQEVDFLKTQGYAKEKFPNAKTQAWSIGLTVLEASLLESSEQLYQMPGRKIKEQELQSRINKIKASFPNLYPFLSPILKIQPSQRMTSGQCWSLMRPYSQKITALESFKRNQTKQNESVRKFFNQGSVSR